MALTLSQQRGYRYGTFTRTDFDGAEFTVKVTRTPDDYYLIEVVGGPFRSYTSAGVIRRQGRYFTLQPRDAQGVKTKGYTEEGSLADNVERVVHSFLTSVHYAQVEAAKTPEQREAEAQERRETRNSAFNVRISKEADALLALLDELVPDSTVHYAVEDARRALKALSREAAHSRIATTALKTEA